jgi:Domain of unknown function (DUF4167)
MRNGQNNKRMRNRNNNNNNNNNRRGQNPMTRVFESNGPDIKIRGTASHVAEKYVQLARDARSSGDPVAAENYYQHAEHYFRLIAAAQEQFRQNQPQPRIDADVQPTEDGEDDGESFSHFGSRSPISAITTSVSAARASPISATSSSHASIAASATVTVTVSTVRSRNISRSPSRSR